MAGTPATASITVIDSTLIVAGVTTLTVGGVTYTFVSGTPSSTQIQVGATDPLTAANIAIRVSTDALTALCTASANLDTVTLTASTPGVAGNSIPLSTNAVVGAVTVSGFAGGTSNTSYANLEELLPLIGVKSDEGYLTHRLQRLLNTAARLFDQETRKYIVEGQEAYSASPVTTRYFDDCVTGYSVEIGDLLSVTSVVRGSTTLTTDQYKLMPLNRGDGPITEIQFRGGVSVTYDTDLHYQYQQYGFVAGGIAITGVWGYCTEAARPDAIKNAVLDWAAIMYKTNSVNVADLLQMATVSGPMTFMAANVRDTIKAFKRKQPLRIA